MINEKDKLIINSSNDQLTKNVMKIINIIKKYYNMYGNYDMVNEYIQKNGSSKGLVEYLEKNYKIK